MTVPLPLVNQVVFFFGIFLKVRLILFLALPLQYLYIRHLLHPLILQVDLLTEVVSEVMTESLRNRFEVQSDVLSLGLMGVVQD